MGYIKVNREITSAVTLAPNAGVSRIGLLRGLSRVIEGELLHNISTKLTVGSSEVALPLITKTWTGADGETHTLDARMSAGAVCDTDDGTTVTDAIEVVDLGSLTWYRSQWGAGFRIYAFLSGQKGAASGEVANALIAGYSCVSANDAYQQGVDGTFYLASDLIGCFDSSYEDASDFKTAMAGVLLLYEKATPDITTRETPLDWSFSVAPADTEAMYPQEGAPLSFEAIYYAKYGVMGALTQRRRAMMGAKGGRGHNLPAEYQEVEWLGFSGTQYMQTNFVITTNNFKAVLDITTSSSITTEQDIISNRSGSQSVTAGTAIIGIYSGAFFVYSRNSLTSDTNALSGSISALTRYMIEAEYANTIKSISVNGTIADTKPMAANIYSDIAGVAIGCIGPRKINYFTGKLHSCEMDDATGAFMGYPCYRKSDNKPGMYDIVNDRFYTNSGTGEFTVGPDVN